MNPYLIIGALVALAAAFGGGDYLGHGRGIDEQKVADQKIFDQINAGLAKQKAEANALYQQAQADIIALQAERDDLKTTLEKEREEARKTTDDLRSKYAGLSLRFRSVQSGGNRPNGAGAQSAGGNPASPATASVLQLPDQVAGNLRQLAFDADKLRDDYALCYGYANKVK